MRRWRNAPRGVVALLGGTTSAASKSAATAAVSTAKSAATLRRNPDALRQLVPLRRRQCSVKIGPRLFRDRARFVRLALHARPDHLWVRCVACAREDVRHFLSNPIDLRRELVGERLELRLLVGRQLELERVVLCKRGEEGVGNDARKPRLVAFLGERLAVRPRADHASELWR